MNFAKFTPTTVQIAWITPVQIQVTCMPIIRLSANAWNVVRYQLTTKLKLATMAAFKTCIVIHAPVHVPIVILILSSTSILISSVMGTNIVLMELFVLLVC